MDSQRFDALTRLLSGASRRQVLSALAASLLGHMALGPYADEVAAACKGFNAKCKGNGSCCAADGLRCVKVGKKKKGKKAKKRCRCKTGTCPDQTPCCLGGKCEEMCDGECCADCFIVVDDSGIPQPGTDECCPANMICGGLNPKKLFDDLCCIPGEECADGVCCNNAPGSPFGSVVCGGTCCSVEACCNGKCCGEDQVCATTPQGDACVSDSRPCSGPGDCFTGEGCHGGACCSGKRVCSNEEGEDFCCPFNQYCELQGDPMEVCCAINDTCNSFKGRRVRR